MSAWSNNVLIEQDSDEINDLEYVPVARHIPRAQTIMEEYFESSGLFNEYYLDTTLVFQKPKGKCQKITAYTEHVFEIFGRYTNETVREVRSSFVDYVKGYSEYFAKCMVVILTMENMSLTEWINNMEKVNTCADEAALYGLCHMFSRHSLVYTIGNVWTMLNLTNQTSVQCIQVKCDLHFAFLDRGIIGILLRKPCVPKLISMGNTINNPLPFDLSQKPVCKTNRDTNELGSDGLLNSSCGEYDFSFDSIAPSYDTPDVFSTTSPSSTVGASLSTTPTIQSPKSDQSFDSQAPSPRPYYMPQITNLPGPLFESSDDATSDHTYAQNKSARSSALPEVTADTSQVNSSCDLAKNKDCDVTQQLLDTTPLKVATNTLRHDATSTDTYKLPDETTVSISDCTSLPDVTTNSINK